MLSVLSSWIRNTDTAAMLRILLRHREDGDDEQAEGEEEGGEEGEEEHERDDNHNNNADNKANESNHNPR